MLKNFTENITSKFKGIGTSIIDINLLTNNSWFFISEENLSIKKIYIFRGNGQLLVSTNGDVVKATWEMLIHATNSLLIEIENIPQLYNIVFLTNDYLILVKDGTEQYNIFTKQDKYNSGVTNKKGLEPFEYVFSDLKAVLNSKNTIQKTQEISIKSQPNLNSKLYKESFDEFKDIDVEFNDSDVEFNDIIKENKIFNFDSLSLNFTLGGEFQRFDILFELEQQKMRGSILSKSEEVDFITNMQNLEDELIESKLVCKHCKAIESIIYDFCKSCNQFIGKKQLINYDKFMLDEIDKDTISKLKKHNIKYENQQYKYDTYFYEKAKDAISYAEIIEKKHS